MTNIEQNTNKIKGNWHPFQLPNTTPAIKEKMNMVQMEDQMSEDMSQR